MTSAPSSIRARLSGAVVAFLLGFGVANAGLVLIPRPDMWLWLAFGIVLMLTGVAGVLFADTRRSLSVWALLGVELFVAFTVAPLLWVFSAATAESDSVRQTLWPESINWSAFSEVLDPSQIRGGMGASMLIGTIATVLAMAVAIPAAYALVDRKPRGTRWWYALFVAALVAPVFVFAAPGAAQLLDFGMATSRWAMAIPTLIVSLPLAVWLTVRAFGKAPWSLSAAVRADGASFAQWLRHFALPNLGLDLLLVTSLVFFWTTADVAMGVGLAATEQHRTLSAVLLDSGSDPESLRLVAAAGLWWLLPFVVISAVFSRRLVSLLGRQA